jgi:cytochrome c peroxidase
MRAMLVLLALCAAPQAQAAEPAAGLLSFTPAELQQIQTHGPWPPPRHRDASNRWAGQAAAVAFGRQLFFDASLSAKGDLACASCHIPARAFQDGRAVALPAGERPRNTPSLFDAGGQRWLGWDGAHDSLWAASVTPLLAAGEMAADPVHLAKRLQARPALERGYRQAFGRPLPADPAQLPVDLGKALAAYQATLVSPRTPFDDFRDALARGNRRSAARYPLAAQRGLRLFIGEGRCTVCHAGPGFTNGEFADVGVPFFVPGGVDSGRHGGLQRLLASPWNRLGPHNDAGPADPQAVATRHVVQQHRNFGEFRVPGLRQLVHTGPYMHNGSRRTLPDVVRHYSELDEERLHTDGERILRPLRLSPQQAEDLLAFLHSLSTASPAAAR